MCVLVTGDGFLPFPQAQEKNVSSPIRMCTNPRLFKQSCTHTHTLMQCLVLVITLKLKGAITKRYVHNEGDPLLKIVYLKLETAGSKKMEPMWTPLSFQKPFDTLETNHLITSEQGFA